MQNVSILILCAASYILNVKEPPFNAKGDGKTDDRKAIQKALNQASVSGPGAVYVPTGHYRVTASGYGGLGLPSNVMFFGNGASSILVYTNLGAAIYAIGKSNVLVRQIAVDGKGQGLRGIELQACPDSTVADCWVFAMHGYSIYLHHQGYNARCVRCTVQRCHVVRSEDVGIEARGATGCSIIGNTVSGAGNNPFHVGIIAWDGATDCLIADNVSEYSSTNANDFVSFAVHGVEGSEAPWDTRRIRLSNNVSRNAGTGFVVYGEPTVPNHPSDIWMNGNTISNPSGFAFMLANCSNVTISENTIVCAPGVPPLDIRCPPLYPWFGMVTNLTCHGNTVNGMPYEP